MKILGVSELICDEFRTGVFPYVWKKYSFCALKNYSVRVHATIWGLRVAGFTSSLTLHLNAQPTQSKAAEIETEKKKK